MTKYGTMKKVWEKLPDVAQATTDAGGKNTHPEGIVLEFNHSNF